jgi:hypothetical protein
MNHPIRSVFELAALASISLVNSAFAVVNIAYVPVGSAGNANDSTGYGAVAYDYQIAKNETTIGQYAEFLNMAAKSDPYALYSTNMASDAKIAGISRSGSEGGYSYSVIGSSANKPITYVSWFDAARFCNWLHNGQGSGSTETGAYTLNGAMSGIYTVTPGAQTWIPSENEWYKAAYYDATKGGSGGYWQYPTQSNTLGGNTIGVPNSANYNDGDFVGSGNASAPISDALTDVGAMVRIRTVSTVPTIRGGMCRNGTTRSAVRRAGCVGAVGVPAPLACPPGFMPTPALQPSNTPPSASALPPSLSQAACS